MSSKWLFLRKFPPINESLESIDVIPDHIADNKEIIDDEKMDWLISAPQSERKTVLNFRLAGPNRRKWLRKLKWTKSPAAHNVPGNGTETNPGNTNISYLNSDPIEIGIQNVARLW